MLRITEIKLPLNHNEDAIKEAIIERLNINSDDLINYQVFRRAYDARRRSHIFLVYSFDIELKNEAGKVYYIRHLTEGYNEIKININRTGNYTANFNATATKQPLQIINAVDTLPEKERDLKTELNFIGKNLDRTPARIYANFGVIEYDKKKFASYPIPFKVFILLHEIGHFFYTTEWKCDIFALYHFTRLGYNASNAFYCLSTILNDPNNTEQHDRIKNLFNAIPHFKNQ